MVGDFDFVDEQLDKKQMPAVPPLVGQAIVEIKGVKVKPTKNGDGTGISVEFRVGTKPWNGKKAFRYYYTNTTSDDEKKIKAAKWGADAFGRLVRAAGYVKPDKATELEKLSMQLGLAQPYDPLTFGEKSLIGKFVLATFEMGEPDENGKAYPEITRVESIDPNSYKDLISACDFTRSDDGDPNAPEPAF